MTLKIRLRYAAATGAAAVGIFSGCLASRHQTQTYRQNEGPEVFNAAPYEGAEPYHESPGGSGNPSLILPAPSTSFQEFPAGKPPALPPANAGVLCPRDSGWGRPRMAIGIPLMAMDDSS